MDVARCLDLGDRVVCITPGFEVFRADIVSREDARLCDSIMLLAVFVANQLDKLETWLRADEQGVMKLEDRADIKYDADRRRRWFEVLKEMYEEMCVAKERR